MNFGDKDIARFKLCIGDLCDGQFGHLGQPLGYLVPNDAAEEDEVSREVIVYHFRWGPEVYGGGRIFRTYVPE